MIFATHVDRVMDAVEQARRRCEWIWVETNGDYWSYQYQEAQRQYDEAVAEYNRVMRFQPWS